MALLVPQAPMVLLASLVPQDSQAVLGLRVIRVLRAQRVPRVFRDLEVSVSITSCSR